MSAFGTRLFFSPDLPDGVLPQADALLSAFRIFGTLTGPKQVIALDGLSSSTAVPLPAALPLFASGLAGLGWMSRRRRCLSPGQVATQFF
jgi:hypothetical protein